MDKIESNSIEDSIFLGKLESYFNHALGNLASSFIGVIIIALVSNKFEADIKFVLIWVVLIFSTSIFIIFLEILFKRKKKTIQGCKKLFRIRFILGLLLRVIYGISPFIFYHERSIVPTM